MSNKQQQRAARLRAEAANFISLAKAVATGVHVVRKGRPIGPRKVVALLRAAVVLERAADRIGGKVYSLGA